MKNVKLFMINDYRFLNPLPGFAAVKCIPPTIKNAGVARTVMVIVIGNEHYNMSSNPGRGWLHFTLH